MVVKASKVIINFKNSFLGSSLGLNDRVFEGLKILHNHVVTFLSFNIMWYGRNFYPEDGGIIFRRKYGICLPHYKVP
jgi:hypothetical protein